MNLLNLTTILQIRLSSYLSVLSPSVILVMCFETVYAIIRIFTTW